MAQRNAKPGTYPNADRANIFGTLFMQFCQNEGKLRAQAFNGMRSVVYPIALRRKDTEYMRLYDEAAKDGFVEDAEMERLVMEMHRVMDDSDLWTYSGTEFLDDMEEVTVDLATA